jgi:hypothetical protein
MKIYITDSLTETWTVNLYLELFLDLADHKIECLNAALINNTILKLLPFLVDLQKLTSIHLKDQLTPYHNVTFNKINRTYNNYFTHCCTASTRRSLTHDFSDFSQPLSFILIQFASILHNFKQLKFLIVVQQKSWSPCV